MTLFAAAAVVLASTPTSTPWRLGAVCEHMGNYTNGVRAQDMLRGKHLRVLNLGWAPFATVDASAPKGWTGLDVDLLNHYSWLLGFTWEMHDIGYPATTWTQHVIDYSYQGDLVGSFWVPSAERRDHMIQLRGHLDVSTILGTPLPRHSPRQPRGLAWLRSLPHTHTHTHTHTYTYTHTYTSSTCDGC
jgi:hypothetical protein